MALVRQYRFAMPLLWLVAFCAVAVAAPPPPIPPVTALLAIALIALTMMALSRDRRETRLVPVAVGLRTVDGPRAGIIMMAVSAGVRARPVQSAVASPPLDTDDTIDLVRMDGNGGWQVSAEPTAAEDLIPGAREEGVLTGTLAASAQLADASSTMDAATTAERRREGGGAPSQRRSARESWRWDGGRSARAAVHQFLIAARAWSPWRMRTNHV